MDRNFFSLVLLFLLLPGCAGLEKMAGASKLEVPPEFNQKVLLEVSDDYQMHQAPRSGYDVGDLQAFHTQHTLPLTIEGAFKEMFPQVQTVESRAQVETGQPEVPAIFEVRILDLGHDNYTESTSYRAVLTLAVAMKSPGGHIFWQKAFRGDGYVTVDPQFSTGLGPQDAVLDALRDAIDQMQKEMIKSPAVRNQLKYYMSIDQARKEKEVTM